MLVARETKSCAACRAADKIRPCLYCGAQLGKRQSKCCGAPACKVAHRKVRSEIDLARGKERYQNELGYRETVLARNATWRAANPETNAASQRKYYEANRERRIAQAAAHATRRRALKKGTQVIPFTAEQLRQRLSVYDRCWICRSGSWEEVDHVKPLAKGGPHILANLRPACRNCNRRKSATWPLPTSERG